MKKKALILFIIFCSCIIYVQAQQAQTEQKLSSSDFIHSYGNLNNATFYIQKKKKITIAFLGGSITNMNGWRNKVMQYLQDSFPLTKFTFINAGIPSLGSLPDAFRLQNDVLDKGKIDLMFIESAVNDLVNETPVTQQRRSLEGIVRHALHANPYMDMIIMAFVDEDKIADYNAGKIPAEINVHNEISKYYHLPFINLAEEVTRRIAHKEFTWKDDFKSLHPSPFGQEIYFATIKRLLQNHFADANIKKVSAKKLPAPLQNYNYENGKYISIEKAYHKNHFQIDTSWAPSDNVNTRPGFVNVPILVADQPGASFDFTFNGTAVGLALVAGPDAGIIKYSIDDVKESEEDIFTKWSKNLYLPWFVLLGDSLKKEKHTLHLEITGKHNENSKGSVLRIIHFLVNE
jgi:sialidase-1